MASGLSLAGTRGDLMAPTSMHPVSRTRVLIVERERRKRSISLDGDHDDAMHGPATSYLHNGLPLFAPVVKDVPAT